jgi:outer membrane lipopolysaccharide assembly protein LptE/RlpB
VNAAFFTAITAVGLLTSCGYHVSGQADLVPKNIKTICIPAFGNGTTRYTLTDRLPEALTREFIARTRYQIVNDMNQADAILRGNVVNFFSYPTVFDPNTQRASTVQVIVIMSVTLTERATGKVLYTRPAFDWKQQYEISADARSFFDESDVALTRLSRDVARMLVSAILENF